MKKVRIVTIALILVMALAFAFTSCKKEPEDNLAKIKKAGKITIAMEGHGHHGHIMMRMTSL